MVVTAILAGRVPVHLLTVRFPWNSLAKTRYSWPTSNGYAQSLVSVWTTTEWVALSRNRSETLNVILTIGAGGSAVLERRVWRLPKSPFEARPGGSVPFWTSWLCPRG